MVSLQPRSSRYGSDLLLASLHSSQMGRTAPENRSRPRRFSSPRRFLQLSVISLAALFVVVTSGAFVRLTASGLGCDNWPRCGDKPFPEQGFHAFVEFGNRMVALVGIVLTLVVWLVSRRVEGLSRGVRLTALAAFLGTVAQIPLGGVTVILELHPVAVMSHFLLALAVVALAVVVALEAWSHLQGRGAPVGPAWWRRFATLGVVACLALVVTGAVATASGPHSGGEEIRRLGVPITDAVWVHVRATAVYGIGLVAVGLWIVRHRGAVPGIVRLGLVLLLVLLAQMLVGEIQYRNALPWGLVLVHVFLGAAIWTLTVTIVHTLWRPPVPLLGAAARERGPAAELAGGRPVRSTESPIVSE
jgi:cytochrome c oxidase assembly protein subunit 15